MDPNTPLRRALTVLGLGFGLLMVAYSARNLSAQSPANPDPRAFAIEIPPERLPSGAWRLRWTSVPGRLYKLQRWNSADLGVPAIPAWSDVAMVRATTPLTTAEAPSAVTAPKGFYRVVQLEETGEDNQPPVISPINARFTSANLAPAATLTVSATDNLGVTRVEVFNGIQSLGDAQRTGAGDTWSFVIGLDPNQLGARFLLARAYDAAGNFANSPVFPLGLVDPDHFVPLGTNGLPVEGGIVPAVAPETWGPVEYRPGGRSLFGAGAGFFLRFPSGVFLRRIEGRQVLEFTHVQAGFGAGYPLQFPALLERNATPARQLPIGPVSVAQILALFDLPADRGLPVTLYHRFQLQWTAGAVDDGGILGARFRLAQSGVPLPPDSGDYPEFRLDFTRSRGVSLPFQGEFQLPDGSENPTRLFVGAGSPLWLTLRPDGQISLNGSAGVSLPNGGFFRADVRLDDPFYQLSISADRARLQALGSLADLLPNNASACLPAQSADAQLTQATRCLSAFRNAFAQFSGSLAAAESGLGATGAQPAMPPSAFDAAGSVLESWAFSALASTQAGLPLDLIRDLVRQAGQTASGAHDLESAVAQRLALTRLRTALTTGGMTATPEARAELDLALAESDAATLARLADPDAVASVGGLTRALRSVLDTEALRQQAGLPPSTLLDQGIPDLLNRFAQRYTSSLGVTRSDEFTPVNNPVIRNLDRFTAAEHVHQLVDLMANAQILGVTLQTTLLDEALGQLATQLFLGSEAQLNAAEARGDSPAFVLALQDLVELIAARNLAIFPNAPALAALPDVADLAGYLQRLGVLLTADLEKPLGERSLNNQAAEVRALLAVFRSVPASVTFASGPLRRAFDQLELRLATATGDVALASVDRLAELLELLEAGTLHAEYGRRFGFTLPVDWETVRLPKLVARLGQVATDTGAWSQLDDAARLLLDAADRQGLRGQQIPRRNTLVQVAALLQSARGTARTMIQQNGGVAGWVDLLLPGDISVDEVAGSVRYHRLNQTFAGSFRGQLQLPKFGTRLNVQNASLRSAGAFDLAASGNLELPANSPALRAHVPDAQPLHLSWAPGEGLRLAGAALFQLTNGMFFRGQIQLEDPIYQFHLEAGGLQIGLAHDLASHIPSFPPASAFQREGALDETGLELWSDYLSGMSATLGSLGLSTNRTAQAVGERSEFGEPAPTDVGTAALDTWSELSALENHFGARSNSLQTLAPAAQIFAVLSDGNTTSPERLGEAVGDPSTDPVTPPPAGSTLTPPPSLAGVLQFDLGQSDTAPAVAGPAQALGRSVPFTTTRDVVLPDNPGTWNHVGPLGSTAVRFADNTVANGISIAVGRGIAATDLNVDPSRSPVTSVFPSTSPNRRAGVFNTTLMEDSLTGLPTGAGPGTSLGVRLRGLPPGYYYVLGLITSGRDSSGRFLVHSGSSAIPSASHETQLLRRPNAGEDVTLWTLGDNFTLGTAEIAAPGADLLVVSERLPSVPALSGELLAGELAGLQVLAPRVRLASFASDANRIPIGSRIQLHWDTRHAQRIVLTGTDQTRLEFGPEAGTHEISLAPAQTVTYTLTVTNRNGPALTSNLVVRVHGAQAIQNGIATATKKQFEISERARELIEASAECQRRGDTNCTVPDEEICAMVQPLLRELRGSLLDCESVTAGSPSAETLLTTLTSTLNLLADLTSRREDLDCTSTLDDLQVSDFTPFGECVLLEVYARSGLTNALINGTDREFGIDATRLRTFQVADSLRLLQPTLGLAGQVAGLGSTFPINTEWAVAHGTNMLRRIREGAGTPALAADRLESELASFAEGLLLLPTLASFDPEAIPVLDLPPLNQIVANALLAKVRANLAQYQSGTFGLWLANPRYWEQEVVQLRQAVTLNRLAPSASVSNLIHTAALDVAQAMKGGADFSTELRPHDVQTLQFLQPFLPEPEFADAYRQRVRLALEFIDEQLPSPPAIGPLEQLQRSVRFLPQLADLQLLIDQAATRNTSIDLRTTILPLRLATNLLETARLTTRQLKSEEELLRYLRAVFEVRANLKVGLSTLLQKDPPAGSEPQPTPSSPGSRSLHTPRRSNALAATPSPATEAFGLGLVRQSYLALQDASALTRDRVAQFRTDQDASRSPEFGLPAGLRVDRVFGEFYFNRQTGFLQGGFGGALAFPDAGLAATIDRARVANDGSFTVQATAATPLPTPGFFLTAGLNLDFAPGRGLLFEGAGSLTLPSNVTTQTLSLSLFYDEPGRRLGYQLLAEDNNLQLGEDVVLFDLGGGLELGTESPTGKVTLRGSLGLFARAKPLPASVTRSNYWLTVDDAVVTFAVEANATVASIEGGTLRLPEFFSPGLCVSNVPGASVGPAVALNPAAPLRITFRPGQPTPSFSGELNLSRLGLRVPGLTNLAVEVCQAKLQFPSNGLPRLTNLTATVQIPLPGQTNRIDLTDASWAIDGFPLGTLRLRDNLRVFQQGGFDLTLLGSAANACSLPTALTVAKTAAGTPFFRLDGALEFGVPPEVLGNTNGGRVFLRTCGFLSGGPDSAPQIALNDLALGGTFRLGGAQGLLIDNGLLSLEGLTNLYAASESKPFIVRLSGNVNVPAGPRLGLQDARFTFTGAPAPRFTLAGFSVAQNPEYEAAPGLSLNVTAGSLTFLNDQLPLPQLLFPNNVVLGLSATAAIPPGPNPVITGTVQGLTLRMNNGRLEATLSGFGVSLVNFEIPPLTLTGEIFLGGLDSATAQDGPALAGLETASPPTGLFFAGRVGGTLNDVGVKALVAFDMNGPIGVCLDANAGPAGIPLGPTGFLLTGAQGGVSFKNSNGDPCDFTTFYPVGADGRPLPSEAVPHARGASRPGAAMTWEEYRESLARTRLEAEVEREYQRARRPSPTLALAGATPAAGDAPEFPCPTGDCPPASVNILCQPHPDEARFPAKVIMKFSSLDTKALDQFGVTRGFVESLGATPAAVGDGVAASLRSGIDPLIPRADPGLLGASRAAQLNEIIEAQLNQFEATLSELIRLAAGGGGSIYDRVVETAYSGVPCPDATVKLAGTFSHAAVSTALSGTVGVVLSSSGSAGLVGSLNVMGVPVGRMRSFVNVTDERGDPNPSYCGDAFFALGPIEFGALRSKFECPGCVSGFLGAFTQLTGCMAETTVRATLQRVAPQHASKPVNQALAALSDEEKIGFVAHVLSTPPAPGLADCWRNAAQNALQSFAPAFALCGAVQPKIFGIPLGDSVIEVRASASRTNLAASFAFSPTYIVNNLGLCGATLGLVCQPVFPALDSATLGFGLGFPDPVAASVDALNGRLSSPEAFGNFTRAGFDHLLANATLTIGYQLNPFGFKLADGEGRAIFPNLTAHPARPGAPAFVLPEQRGLPSRLDLLLGALQNDLLANPLWKGSAADLHLAFPEGSSQRAALQNRNITFAKDYFPHGGFLGAGRIALPRLLVDAPPAELGVVFDAAQDPLERLGAAADVIGNYLLQTTNLGTLAFYVPAPNPPFFADAEGQPLSPEQLLQAIGTFDLSVPNLANPYPFQVSFLRGQMEGRLIGIPLARAEVLLQPATVSSPAFLRATGSVPTNSWVKSFLESANLAFEIRQAPPLPIGTFFTNLQATVVGLAAQPAPSPAAMAGVLRQVEEGVADALPKVSMELLVNNLRIPAPLTNLLTTANASAGLFAYSPRFQPSLVATSPVQRARRDGGIALRGSFRFANLVTVSNAELAVSPKLNPVELPALSGLLQVGEFPLVLTTVRNANLEFNTEPRVGEPFLHGSGTIDPVVFRHPLDQSELLSIRPLTAGATTMAGRLAVVRSGANGVAASLQLDPARLRMGMLGPDLAILVHGATTNTPFSLSTTEPWSASVSIQGALSIRDLTGLEVARLGLGQQKFSATLTGTGLALDTVQVAIPGSLQLTVFPTLQNLGDLPRTYTLGAGSGGSLIVRRDGTFTLTASLDGALNLPGLPAPALRGGSTL
ncbi:MAG: hypothetical protein IT580_12400, partial [Verrucomicrobiales bacterium]|nr:hypothetical protein [Verrucomicrobiales bacterium]